MIFSEEIGSLLFCVQTKNPKKTLVIVPEPEERVIGNFLTGIL